jgi:hypothetical protein
MVGHLAAYSPQFCGTLVIRSEHSQGHHAPLFIFYLKHSDALSPQHFCCAAATTANRSCANFSLSAAVASLTAAAARKFRAATATAAISELPAASGCAKRCCCHWGWQIGCSSLRSRCVRLLLADGGAIPDFRLKEEVGDGSGFRFRRSGCPILLGLPVLRGHYRRSTHLAARPSTQWC